MSRSRCFRQPAPQWSPSSSQSLQSPSLVGGAGRWCLAAGLAVTAAVLIGCSPAYDWRTVTDNSDGYAIDLPAKPTADERPIDIAGQAMPMHMRAAHAAGAVFAVGTIELPSDDPQLQRTVLDYLRTGLARNLGAVASARPVQVPLAAGGQVPALEIAVSGTAGAQSEHKVIQAWLVARGKHVYQATIAADKAVPREQSDQFFESFKVY
jgi:hypothetical protein